jgi:hypothetical protein
MSAIMSAGGASGFVELVGDTRAFFVAVFFGWLIGDHFAQRRPLLSSPNHAPEARGRKSARLFALDKDGAFCVAHGVAALKDIFVYDLMAKLRNDSGRSRTVQEAIDNVRNVQHKVAAGKADRTEVAQAMAKVVTHSGFNFGLLLPYIFPRYPTVDPLSVIPRPFMFVMMSLAANSVLTLRAGRQVGKCADGDTVIETESHGELTLSQLFAKGIASN